MRKRRDGSEREREREKGIWQRGIREKMEKMERNQKWWGKEMNRESEKKRWGKR